MRKQVEESTAAESARRATGPAAERDRKGRFSARRKRATVLRLLRGENLESVSRELGITAARRTSQSSILEKPHEWSAQKSHLTGTPPPCVAHHRSFQPTRNRHRVAP